MKYDNEQDLIAQANDSCFGLAAGIWTESYRKAWRIARALEVGTVWINTYKNSRLVRRLVALKTVGLGAKRPFGHFIVHATKEYLYGAE